MGGAVSAGRNNDELIDNLVTAKYIVSNEVEEIFRAVDRGDYYLEEHRDDAYHDVAWRHDHLHISAPCIYSKVVTALDLREGLSFLNIGSGTGYLSTMVGLFLGSNGINHGIELHEDVVQYAREKVQDYILQSPSFDRYAFCEPEFVIGNGLNLHTDTPLYDRIYCGAACPTEYFSFLKNLLNVDGIMVLPMNEQLKRVKRVKQGEWKIENLLVVNFADLVLPTNKPNEEPVVLPARKPQTLCFLCRASIRQVLSRKYHSGSNRRFKKRRRRDEPIVIVPENHRTREPTITVPNLDSGAERISITPAIVSDTESLASEDLDHINNVEDLEPPTKRSSILNLTTNTVTTVGDDEEKNTSSSSSSGNNRSSGQSSSWSSKSSASNDDVASTSIFKRGSRKSKKKEKPDKKNKSNNADPKTKRARGWAYIRQKFKNRKHEKSIFSPSARKKDGAGSSSGSDNNRSFDRDTSKSPSAGESELELNRESSRRDTDMASLFIEMAPHLDSPRARQLQSLNYLLRGVNYRLRRTDGGFGNDIYDEEEEFMTDEEIEQPPNKFKDAILSLPLPHTIKQYMLFNRTPN